MLGSLLIANRGEIARRIIRTARRLGVRTVAVYSEADSSAPCVREADDAVLIGAAPARDSYLDADKILVAALSAGVEAIHPGYGFLSENAVFAQAVADAGLIFVGPSPGAIAAMGRKDEAKARMIAAGTGQLVTNMASGLPPRLPVIFFAATRSFVNSHPKLPESFRAALTDARDAIAKDPDMARAAIAKYTKLPPAAVAGIPMPKTVPDIEAKQLQDWVDIMSAQKMLETKLDTTKLIAK